MSTHFLSRRDLLRYAAIAGFGLAAGEWGRLLPAFSAAEASGSFYRFNDAQDFIRGYNNGQIGIGLGSAWGETHLGNPAMVAENLGGYPFQPGMVDDPVFGQTLDLSVHKLTDIERSVISQRGDYIIKEARRLGTVAQDFASSAFHVNLLDSFSHLEVSVKLPRGIHDEGISGTKILTGIDNTFVGIWVLPDLVKLSSKLAALQKNNSLSDLVAGRIKRRFADVHIEIDVLEAVGHSEKNLASIMSGVHLQGYQAQVGDSLTNDRAFFYNTMMPEWLQFMKKNNAPFNWDVDYLSIVFDFDPDGHWRVYFNEVEMVNSKTVLESSRILKDELLRRIPVRQVDTPVGPLTIPYYVIFHAAAGGAWPGQPIAPNVNARDGLRVANLLIR